MAFDDLTPELRFDAPEVRWALRLVVAVQCWGVALRRFHVGLESTIGDVLFHDLEWSEAAMLLTEDAAAWCMLAAGVLTLLRPCWPVLGPVSLWMLLLSLAQVWRDDGFVPQLEPLEQAARVCAPLALLLIEFWPPKRTLTPGRTQIAVQLLRIGTALTFFGHGLVALWHNPQFIDLIITSGQKLLGKSIPESACKEALTVIGYIDIALAVALCCTRSRAVAGYMAFWGVVTAASRIVHQGESGIHEALVRAANGGAPLVLLLYWSGKPLGKSPDQEPEPRDSWPA